MAKTNKMGTIWLLQVTGNTFFYNYDRGQSPQFRFQKKHDPDALFDGLGSPNSKYNFDHNGSNPHRGK